MKWYTGNTVLHVVRLYCYLRQGDYVFAGFCLFVCLCVCTR